MSAIAYRCTETLAAAAETQSEQQTELQAGMLTADDKAYTMKSVQPNAWKDESRT